MPVLSNTFRLISKLIRCKACRVGLSEAGAPITLTYSVTAACQSKCKTCNIGMRYQSDNTIRQADLKLDEIDRIFKSIGRVYFFNISGGEPFLRKDLPDIIHLACIHLKPKIIHIPTNGIASEAIRDLTLRSLDIIRKHNPKLPLTIKPSIDGIGDLHDQIRGVPGNFKLLRRTIQYLKEIEKEYPNLHVELGTVISKFNMHCLSELEDYVHSLGVQSYRNEIAECRAEFFNLGEDITPDPDTYSRLILEFSRKIREDIATKRTLTKTTESLRLVYYDLAVRILKESRQVIPCFAGISNVHINYDGEVWPCCVLGYLKSMGSLREYNFDFKELWRSERAKGVRKFIKGKNCACPLANQAYSNIICSLTYLLKALRIRLRYR